MTPEPDSGKRPNYTQMIIDVATIVTAAQARGIPLTGVQAEIAEAAEDAVAAGLREQHIEQLSNPPSTETE